MVVAFALRSTLKQVFVLAFLLAVYVFSVKIAGPFKRELNGVAMFSDAVLLLAVRASRRRMSKLTPHGTQVVDALVSSLPADAGASGRDGINAIILAIILFSTSLLFLCAIVASRSQTVAHDARRLAWRECHRRVAKYYHERREVDDEILRQFVTAALIASKRLSGRDPKIDEWMAVLRRSHFMAEQILVWTAQGCARRERLCRLTEHLPIDLPPQMRASRNCLEYVRGHLEGGRREPTLWMRVRVHLGAPISSSRAALRRSAQLTAWLWLRPTEKVWLTRRESEVRGARPTPPALPGPTLARRVRAGPLHGDHPGGLAPRPAHAARALD